MIEILFRGRRTDTREWVYGHYFKGGLTADRVEGSKPEDGWYFLAGCQDRHFISQNGVVFEVDHETVGQYTGLDDKNGVKVFDGDVLIIDDDRFVISWNEERGGFRMYYWMLDEQYDLSDFWPTSEIIDNIHDNPETMGVRE